MLEKECISNERFNSFCGVGKRAHSFSSMRYSLLCTVLYFYSNWVAYSTASSRIIEVDNCYTESRVCRGFVERTCACRCKTAAGKSVVRRPDVRASDWQKLRAAAARVFQLLPDPNVCVSARRSARLDSRKGRGHVSETLVLSKHSIPLQ